ncbi:MAG: 6-phosphogluconolactonase [Alphaproteobacteria bacterium]|nr:6-phosphogluconolactonase [Alphaproteobacteria bacterium]
MERRRIAGLDVRRFPDRPALGAAAAADIAAFMRARLARQPRLRMIFAAAPSQGEMLAALIAEPGIDWPRVVAFHMDEYHTLPAGAPQRFGNWLRRALFAHVSIGEIRLIEAEADPSAAMADYARHLAMAPIDAVCLGIGVNGHLAFNDPPVADLADPLDVKLVELDETCRRQQVDDGAFTRLDDVPRVAVTLTVPRLLRADRLFCVVPGPAKREAVRRSLHDPIGAACPGTALRLHGDCTLYVDRDSHPEPL